MDGANFISKVVNDIATTALQSQTEADVAAQTQQIAGAPEAIDAPLINGLTAAQVEALYHRAVAEQDAQMTTEDGVERTLVQAAASINGAQAITDTVSGLVQTTFATPNPMGALTLVSTPALGAQGGFDGPAEHSALLFVPNDTLYTTQWHLNQTGAGLFDLGDLQTIWDEYTGAGVDVAVMDNGFDRTHEDLVGNYSNAKDWDYRDDDTDASASAAGDNHGTAVAGIIGSVGNNGLGTTGIAFDSTIFGYKVENLIGNDLVDNMIDMANDAAGNDRTSYQADIVNMSYGTMYASNYFDEILDSTKMSALNAAFDAGAVSGRGGLGTVYVKSAGNSRGIDHDGNASSWNANIHTISVAAVDQDGDVSSYSTHGANILISGFGTPGQVVTTDRTGVDGYSSGNYTTGFNGTSAAAPMVSGVIALMLEANSSLGWRDVQEILAYSARHVGTAVGSGISGSEEYAWEFNGANDWNGGGLHFSNDYGFGLVDAFAAVRMAEVWTSVNGAAKTSANDTVAFEDVLNTSITLNGSGVNTFAWTETVDVEIEHVTVDINFIEWDDMGDLDIVLIAADGTEVHLINNIGENDGTSAGGFGAGRWEFTSPKLMGMNSAQAWTLELRDQDSDTISPITINDIDIRFLGKAADDDAHFVYTDEFSTYSSASSHSTNAAGGGTGVDTINAVAVTSNTTINLQSNSGTIDGVAMTNSNIQKVYTGDGNDTITGDNFSTHMYGGRGNDTISIGSTGGGIQSIYGGDGTDSLTGGSAADRIFGDDGNDRLFMSAGGDIMYGGDGNDLFWFDAGDTIAAGTQLYGGAGADVILLKDAGTFDLSADWEASSIAEIQFNGDGSGVSKTLILGSDELQTGELADVLIDGNGASTSDDNIIINMGTETVMDLSGWTFQDWTAVDTITINGDGDAETLTGSSESDTIYGGGGVDTIYGGDGNDTLYGGAGVGDEVFGGDGDDTMEYLSLEGFDHFYGGTGTDTLDLSTYGFGMTYDYTTSTYEQTSGSSAFDMVSIERIRAGAGDDTFLRNSTGGFTIDGGAGIDTLDFSAFTVTIATNERVFDLDLGYSFSGGAFQGEWQNLENLVALANTASTIIGNSSDNILTGSSQDDIISAESGTDTVYGGAGDDVINAGSGTKEYYGGDGDDTIYSSGAGSYYGGNDNDYMTVGNGVSETLDGGAGIDTLDTTTYNSLYNINMTTGVTNFVGESFVNFENLIMGNGGGTIVGTFGANIITGGTGSESVLAGFGSDTIYGGDGDDFLDGEGSTDFVYGGAGNDTVYMADGDGGDSFFGGADVDTADFTGISSFDMVIDLAAETYAFSSGGTLNTIEDFENVNAGGGDDTITGNNAANTVNGNNGDDTIYGGSGLDDVYGGAGDDDIYGDNGADDLFGGADKDKMYGGIGNDAMFGGDGADKMFGDDGLDALYGGSGGDTINGNDGDDTIWGGEGADIIKGGEGNDSVEGDNGFDDINGGAGNDYLDGGGGNDTIIAGSGTDTVYGDGGNDIINGGDNGDIIYGGTQGDEIEGGNGSDTIYGDNGNDELIGNKGNDVMYGGIGLDDMNGSEGNDTMYGDNGHDDMNGGNGGDTLVGGNGDDVLTGGNGSDVFVFENSSDDDTITDFTVGTDTIQLIGLTAGDVAFSNAGGGDTLITLSTGDTILVENTSIGDLNTFSDFDFV